MIYLDNNATTKIDPRVLDQMLPYLTDLYGNASSNHEFGAKINQQVNLAKSQIAELIGCDAEELIFTSGATEAINLAIKGVVEYYQNKGKHIITSVTEHPAVIETCLALEKKGYDVSWLTPDSDGIIAPSMLQAAIRGDTILVSIMLVNNETGIIQDIKALSQLCRERGIIFMTDGTQGVGKIPIAVDEMGIDLMSFSSHKFYGPKGIGCLYIRNRKPVRVKLFPIIHGGGQERGLRSGTLNVPGIVGFGAAAKLSREEMNHDMKRISRMRDRLESELLKMPQTMRNGSLDFRIYNTSNICFEGADADAIMVGMKGIAISNGSACSSTAVEPSHVLVGMGRTALQAFSSIRFSLGRFTNDAEIDQIIATVPAVVANLRELVFK
ncbi:MAG: cysteine desulfurase family protein [Mucilaginibacter sp.]|nr:cysteine desulfurase family protein [Mucilaginibacter sp.]